MKNLILIIVLIVPGILLAQKGQKIAAIVKDKADSSDLQQVDLVSVKTGLHFTTGSNGKVELILQLPDTILISRINYKPERLFINSNRSPLLIILEKTENTMSEVIVNTGYQQIPKERATGSFTSLSEEILNQQIGTTILERLPYITNGLTALPQSVSSGKDIMIRGLSTLYGLTQPLVVVDNFPYHGDISNINPNDVASITILKDAAAASIWGARAANGVIVINTKQAKYDQKIKIGLLSNISVIDKPDLLRLQVISTSDLIDVETFLFDKGYYDADISNTPHSPLTVVVQLLNDYKNGMISKTVVDSTINVLRGRDIRKQYQDYLLSSTINQQYGINLSGGSLSYKWLVSGGYDRNLDANAGKYGRYTFRFNNTYKLGKKLELNANVYYIQTEKKSGKPDYTQLEYRNGKSLPGYVQLADDLGQPLALNLKYRQSYLDSAGGGLLQDWNYIPLEDYQYARSTVKNQSWSVDWGLNYKIASFLSLNLKYRRGAQNITDDYLYDAKSFYARDLVNQYANINYNTGNITYPVPKGGILDRSSSRTVVQHFRGQLSFSKDWSNHSLNAIAGAEVNDITTSGSKNRTYGYDESLLTTGSVDYVNTYYNRINQYYTKIPYVDGFNGGATRFLSIFANGSYTYKKRYIVSASARKDASNIFGLSTNDKWNPLWSAGAAWDIARENFYRIEWLQNLKARVTYGFSGNIDPSKVAATTIIYRGNNRFSNSASATINNYYNPELSWETTRMINYGIDFSSREDRLSGSIEYYSKSSSGLYGPSLMDPTAGVGTYVTKNVADIKSHGWDMQLDARLLTGSIGWSSQFIFNTNNDKVVKVYNLISNGSGFLSGQTAAEGFPIYGMFSYKWKGLDPETGDPVGQIDGHESKNYSAIMGDSTKINQMTFHGSAIPTKFGSWGNTFSYKGLALTFRITYNLGYYFRKSSINYSALFENLAGHADYALRWQQPGDESHTSVPSMIFPSISARDQFYTYSEVLVKRADNIRMQYINLSYTLKNASIKTLPFESLRFTLMASEVGLLWQKNKDGIDPDYSNGLSPRPKFSLGINLGL
ncbi:SusC/RagA family TonB-linked outer membrane protein [Niabella terrae]